MRRPVGVALQRDGGDAYVRTRGQRRLKVVVSQLACDQPEPPPIVVNDHVDVVRIVEGCGTAVIRFVVEVPLWRRELPDEAVELASISLVSKPPAFGGEVVLVPPLKFGPWCQRRAAGRLAADEVSAHRPAPLAPLSPGRRHDVRSPRTPVEAGDDRFGDL